MSCFHLLHIFSQKGLCKCSNTSAITAIGFWPIKARHHGPMVIWTNYSSRIKEPKSITPGTFLLLLEITIFDESRIHTIEMHVNPYLFIWYLTYISAPYTPIHTYNTIQTNINLTPSLSKIMLFNAKSIGPTWTNSLQDSSVSSRPPPRPDGWVPKKSCPYHRQRPLNNNWCTWCTCENCFQPLKWQCRDMISPRNISNVVSSSLEDIHLSNPGLEGAHNLHFFQEESSSDVHSSPGILLKNAPKA